jgi:alanyl-tRNA synthetase
MTAQEIREKYIAFFEGKNHKAIPSALLVPENDPSVLFNTAGMQPLVPYLLGQEHPMGKRLVNVQKCIRTGDIDEVGDDTHLTFFEMLGNWSLGDYFKEESITWSWEFLTSSEWLAIPAQKLSVTVFAGDENAPQDKESALIWEKLGVPKNRIAYLPAEDNWWAAGTSGPCGPDTEIFYWVGEGIPIGNKETHPDSWMEIWNNVFMQYNRINESTLERLPAPCVDTGMGLERTVATLTGVKNVYETDAFSDVLLAIKTLVGEENYNERGARIIADHLRAATHMIADGVVPKNVDQGYILRRLIRRSIREFYKMNYEKPVITEIGNLYIAKFKDVYESVALNTAKIIEELTQEEERFHETLSRGLKQLEKFFNNPIGNDIRQVGDEIQRRDRYANDEVADIIFDLYQTYGFPLEQVFEEFLERDIVIDTDKLQSMFNSRFERHQELSRTANVGKFKGGLADNSAKVTALHTATHLMLAALRKELGDNVHQAGSNITEERTRFDFTYDEKVPREILDKVEAFVNEAITAKAQRSIVTMDKSEARALGVEGSFWEKYPEQVTVYEFKDENGTVYSQELCGGPHVENTEEIIPFGRFVITKEEASSRGVRRIKAVLQG